MTRCITPAEHFRLAEQVNDVDADTLLGVSRPDLSGSARHAPQAGFGEVEFHPDMHDKAVLVCRDLGLEPKRGGKAVWQMGFSKTVIGPDIGRGMDIIQGAEGIDQPAYSQAVRLDLAGFTWIMLSGVVALDDHLRVVGEGDLRAQTRFVLEAIRSGLADQGATMDDICRVRVYVVGDLTSDRFRAIHEERARFFNPDQYPASTLVEVASLIKPELLIEIDADAVFPRTGDSREPGR